MTRRPKTTMTFWPDEGSAVEVRRILDEAAVERAMAGKMVYQRRA